MNLLLDTHTFIWLDESARMCADRNNTLWLSVVSVWEIQIKMQIGKLKLRDALPEIIADQQRTNGLRVLELRLPHIFELQNLLGHHKDPFDRLLIAQAKNEGWEIVSADPEFKLYPIKVIW